MQRALLFFMALAVLVVIAWSVPTSKEGFRSFLNFDITTNNDGVPSNCNNQQIQLVQPTQVGLAQVGVGNIQASPPPASSLPYAPIEARSQEAPNPYRDPSTEPAKYIRILRVKEDLQAFFGFEAPALEAVGEKTIDIPLTRARADVADLVDVQSVIERNPGLPSRISNKQLNDIAANLRYLRKMNQDYIASGVIQAEVGGVVEGFADETDPTANPADPNGPPASKAQLEDFLQKLQAERLRLEASGTSDPVVKSRIDNLLLISNDVTDVLTRLEKGQLTEDTIPIYAADIEGTLPLLGQPDAPLPTLLKKSALPPAIANLFPGGLSPQDTDQMSQITNVANGYLGRLFNDAKWTLGFTLGYDSRKLVSDSGKVITDEDRATLDSNQPLNTGLPGASQNPSSKKPDVMAQVQAAVGEEPALTVSMGGEQKKTFDSGLPGCSDQQNLLNDPGQLDWRQRSQEIVNQIRARGLDPANFGAFPENTEVSANFSWRGYARMICYRLNASTDPGLAVTCGCPPENWPGWRS